MTVRPLYHFPLLRDLVVDMTPFAEQAARRGRRAACRPRAPSAYALIPATRRERRDIDAAIECIGCGMCVSACTMVAHNPRFPGPAALNRAFTLERGLAATPAGEARWAVLLSDDALARCHGQGELHRGVPDGAGADHLDHPPRELATRRPAGLGTRFATGRPARAVPPGGDEMSDVRTGGAAGRELLFRVRHVPGSHLSGVPGRSSRPTRDSAPSAARRVRRAVTADAPVGRAARGRAARAMPREAAAAANTAAARDPPPASRPQR